MSEAENRNEQLVKSFFETLSTGDLERVRPLLHEHATWTPMGTGIPGAGGRQGPRHDHRRVSRARARAVRRRRPEGQDEHDYFEGAAGGVRDAGHRAAENGKNYNNRYAWMIEIKDDKIFALREYMDTYHITTLV